MEVEIIEVLKGEENRPSVKVWGDNGMMCRPYLSRFKEGSTWIIAFSKSNEKRGHREETSKDYYISFCGEFWLQVIDQSVVGIIENEEQYKKNNNSDYIPNTETMSLDDFRKKMKENRE